MFKCLTFLLLTIPGILFAQSTITGKVISLANKKPIANASVFLSNASVGSPSGNDGAFTLSNVRNGQYDLVVTCIGYETYHQKVFVNGTAIKLADMALLPKATGLKEVKIKYDPNRVQHLAIFKREFLGSTSNARECTILNPEIIDLDFEKSSGKLSAGTDDFLMIENKALGYHIKYLLKSFLLDPKRGFVSYFGSPAFEPMAGRPGQQKRWEKKRKEAYDKSDMHFLRSCIANNVAGEGFKASRLIRKPNPERPPDSLIKAKIKQFNITTPNGTIMAGDSIRYWSQMSNLPKIITTLVTAPLSPAEYVKRTDRKGIFALGFKDCLQVTYKNKETQTSIITFYKPYALIITVYLLMLKAAQ